jgi:hypothetical protein
MHGAGVKNKKYEKFTKQINRSITSVWLKLPKSYNIIKV